jgi:DNA-binding response OmpR family regulator
VRVYLKEHRAFFHQRELRLPPKEFKLLEALMRRTGKVCTRMELLDLIWGEEVMIAPGTSMSTSAGPAASSKASRMTPN